MQAEAALSYDRVENIVFMRFPQLLELRTNNQIAAHFDRVVAFWRANAGGKKAYFVVNFDNITIDAATVDFYAQQTKRAHDECAIASVRYGGVPLQRTVTRLAGMKIQRPSNICENLDDALAMVRKLKAAASAKPDKPAP
jgi:hypothetical protein